MNNLETGGYNPAEEVTTEQREAIEGRREIETTDLLREVVAEAVNEDVKRFASLLLKREDVIRNSTVLRGKTKDGTGVGQTTLDGTLDEIHPQVYLIDGQYEQVSMFKLEVVPIEADKERYFEIICHELAHSFTRYIVSSIERNWEEKLNEFEKVFYSIVKELFAHYTETHATGDKYVDKMDEFIARAVTTSEYMSGEYYQRMFVAFEKLYMNNTRKIVSLSKRIK